MATIAMDNRPDDTPYVFATALDYELTPVDGEIILQDSITFIGDESITLLDDADLIDAEAVGALVITPQPADPFAPTTIYIRDRLNRLHQYIVPSLTDSLLIESLIIQSLDLPEDFFYDHEDDCYIVIENSTTSNTQYFHVREGDVFGLRVRGLGGGKGVIVTVATPKKPRRRSAAVARFIGPLPKPKKASQPRAMPKSKPTKMKHSPTMLRYMRCLQNPFDGSVSGVKVPDQDRLIPTVTYQLKTRFSISTSATNTGSLAFAFSGNPWAAFIDVGGINNAANSCVISTGTTALGVYGNNNGVYGLTSTVLNTRFDVGRLVASGARLYVLTPELSRTGTITSAPFVLPLELPGPNILQSLPITLSLGAGSSLYNYGNRLIGNTTPSFAASGAIEEIVGSKTMTLSEMASKELKLTSRATNSACFLMRNTNTGVNATASASQASEILYNPGTGLILPQALDTIESAGFAAGFTGTYVYIDGIAPSTVILGVELIFHFEGTVSLTNTGSGSALVPSGISEDHGGPGLDAILQFAKNIDPVQIIDVAGSVFNAIAGYRSGNYRALTG